MTQRTRMPLEERFWSKVKIVKDEQSCWDWTAAALPAGYGRFGMPFGRGIVLAHRMAYELTNGSIPDGAHIDHMCHRPSCVRPSHLRAVTPKQNTENYGGLRRNNTSGVHGVGWDKREGKWRARVKHQRRDITIGYFDTIEEAEAAAVAKRLELFTHNDLDRVA